jgi:hypothetical protein
MIEAGRGGDEMDFNSFLRLMHFTKASGADEGDRLLRYEAVCV